jgi:HSP20 family protein
MNLTPWRSSSSIVPFGRARINDDALSFQRDMNNLMNSFLTRWDVGFPATIEMAYYPSIDIKEKENKYVIDADVPGMSEADLEMDFKNNVLTLKGVKKTESETKDINSVCLERSYGSFRRDIAFDDEVDSESIRAELKNGVLHVELAKKEKAKQSTKKISIKH